MCAIFCAWKDFINIVFKSLEMTDSHVILMLQGRNNTFEWNSVLRKEKWYIFMQL
jgi:hypothetical protein